jgi:hypothetical protein
MVVNSAFPVRHTSVQKSCVTHRIWTPPKYKKLIDRFGMREKPAVVYPASEVGSVVARADMEFASPLRQSVQAAGVHLPEELSALNSVGASRCAMMVDQSLRKAGWVKRVIGLSGRHGVGHAFDLTVVVFTVDSFR